MSRLDTFPPALALISLLSLPLTIIPPHIPTSSSTHPLFGFSVDDQMSKGALRLQSNSQPLRTDYNNYSYNNISNCIHGKQRRGGTFSFAKRRKHDDTTRNDPG